jgi:hypothetical protein
MSIQSSNATHERQTTKNRQRLPAQVSVSALLVAILFLSTARIAAQQMVIGVNVVNPMRASVAEQNTLLSQLNSSHVHVIRCGISNDDKGIDFTRRAAVQAIRIQLIVSPQYPPDAPRGHRHD